MKRYVTNEESEETGRRRSRGGQFSLGMLVLGSVTWGIAIYYLNGQAVSPANCMALGAGLSFLAGNLWRRMYLITNLILPLLLVGYVCGIL